jgi:hypothetical protein
MTDGLDVNQYMIHEILAQPDTLAEVLDGSDYIFAQTSFRPHAPEAHAAKISYFPVIAFSAYHPDLTFVHGKKVGGEAETVPSPLSGYHSLISVFGYVWDISLSDILTFYHSGVYSHLGYFDQWKEARRQLLDEGASSGFPLQCMFEDWSKGGPFMYSSNHPTLRVVEDIARELLKRIGIVPTVDSVHTLVEDPLRAMPIWPIYPEIAKRLGLHGNMVFKRHEPEKSLTLYELVASSYDCFQAYDRHSLEATAMPVFAVAERLGFTGGAKPAISQRNPYVDAPKNQFWKQAVASARPEDVDPVVLPRFTVSPQDKVATAGSCFAQHIARTLKASGFNYFLAEEAPPELSIEAAQIRNYGVFSARFGNIYTVRQLRQLIERAEGEFEPVVGIWEGRERGTFIDPFRPQIEPDGFHSEGDLIASRADHLASVRRMLRDMDVFIFTLGLTEGWRSRVDGAVFPLAPGVAGGRFDPREYEFVNFSMDEIRSDLHAVIARIAEINPRCRIILTVSPIPLIATYESRHVLVATTYSKSVLRVAADEMWRKYDHVDYFPSYEIIAGSYNRGAYYEEDLRQVTNSGVDHVMKVFMRNYAVASSTERKAKEVNEHSRSSFFDIVCDEEEIVNF